MKPQVYHVDAFTSQPFRGNSAGVVFPADNLSEAQMQLIARELGHSETAFLLHSDDSDVRIRYFTPTVEVPICGHATVAAHYVRSKVSGLGNCTVWQTSLAGKHRVTIEKHNDDYRISLEQGSPALSHRWKVKHVRRLSTRFISLKTTFCPVCRSGGDYRTLKSDDPVEAGSGYRCPFTRPCCADCHQ